MELAKIMAKEDWNLILTARRKDLLRALANHLSSAHNIKAGIFATDLSDPANAISLFEYVSSVGICIDALVNNAGFGMIGSVDRGDSARINELLQLNVVSLTALTRLFLPEMKERGSGKIMNVGSIAGLQPMPLFAVYAASKAYIRSFTEAIAIELEDTGVTATLLAPGPTSTGFGRVAGYKKSRKIEFLRLSAHQVAKQGYEGMMAGESVVVAGKLNKFVSIISSVLPQKITARLAMKGMKRKIS